MTKIKIISNPYQKSISYQRYDNNIGEWVDINIENNSNSNLLKDKYVKGFFPFRVKDIVDEIIAEYHNNSGKTEIVFEGTDDEYKELLELCKGEVYSDIITLSKSEMYLENARDILPDINVVYDENLKPLIMQSVNEYEKVSKEIDKYSDASNDIIPICVLGNYSAGKSTFINALIGSEILPSGAEPVTAKIYKIKQSEHLDRAYIQLRYDQEPVKIRFDESNFKVILGSNALTQKLSEELNSVENKNITSFVNKSLEIINGFDTKTGEEKISDVIEIEVPFISGLWRETTRQFYIFDTPGSNSASNDKHLIVLKEAMESLSNGLPIFISEFDALDSTDNVNLYREIEKMEEIDNRFTMIVVNKADTAELEKGGFSKEKEERILAQAIPKNLYKGGIFFVSSVIGLGAKSGGEFIDDHYAELYEEKHTKFADTSSRFYKTLYKYNIMPEQLKKKSSDLAEGNTDLLFTNSGLYSIEREIQIFAGKYSSYNKCQQAQLFLGKIIKITADELVKSKADLEESRRNRNEALKRDEKELLDKIESTSDYTQQQFIGAYIEYMLSLYEQANVAFSAKQIENQEKGIEDDKRAENDYEDRRADVSSSKDRLFENLKKNVKAVFADKKFEALKTMGRELVDDIKDTSDKYQALGETKDKIDKETATRLLKEVTDEFNTRFDKAQSMLDEKSKQYWEKKAEELKQVLIEIVTGTSVLDEAKREELAHIIITYDNIEFEKQPGEKFLREDFRKGIRIGNFTLYESERIDIDKLTTRYNEEMTEKIQRVRNTVQNSHQDSFRKWKANLVGTVTTNIVEYSPNLHSQSQIIKEIEAKIVELESRQGQLELYTKNIEEMMNWKSV